MERLTKKNWRNLDPWECCGQDNFCKRGCHSEGGCNNGCIVPKVYGKLAAYEDAEELGRLVVLAHNPVWFIANMGTELAEVYSRSAYDLSVYDAMGIDKNERCWSTKEAAETALREMEGENG